MKVLSDDERGEFGTRLYRARKALGLGQEEVAKKAKLSIGGYRNLEGGKTPQPRPDTLKRLAKALKVQTTYLTGEVGQDELAQLRQEMGEVRQMLEQLVADARQK